MGTNKSQDDASGVVVLEEGRADHLLAKMRHHIEEDGPERPVLEHLLPQVDEGRLRLPVISGTLTRVMELTGSEDADIGELTYAVEMDPPLAAKVVGLANTAALRGGEAVTSVHEALMRMGLREARNLVVAVAMRSGVFEVPGSAERVQELWEHSVASALCCQSLLAERPPWQDAGFLLGLVHDIGRIAVMSFIEESGRRSRRLRRLDADARRAAEDILHAELGAVAVGSWNFPEAFVQALRLHHEPDDAVEPDVDLVWSLYAADTLAHLRQRGWEPGSSEELDARVVALLEPLGLPLDVCGHLIREMEGGLAALGKIG
ncbi:MAG: hypothetical protein CL910_14940 [Deltaproteobacteria bacterium]|jgi:HD-like signal output (HDOD) protein|nr:hypothetical protein [Deltaproteobacteria bacterium]